MAGLHYGLVRQYREHANFARNPGRQRVIKVRTYLASDKAACAHAAAQFRHSSYDLLCWRLCLSCNVLKRKREQRIARKDRHIVAVYFVVGRHASAQVVVVLHARCLEMH